MHNLADLNSAGHKLYGTAVSSGLSKLSVLANELEHLNEVEVSKLSQLLEALNMEIAIVIDIIDNLEN